jgi:leucyl aminopeptidase (aminopeptidase T)
VNEIILNSGLARDYAEVSDQAERLRLTMTRSDWFEIEFQVLGRECTLHLDLGGQEAQKSHGLCYEPGEIANLPAGEVYFVPKDANGAFPMLYPNGTLALAHVQDNRIESLELLEGDVATVDAHRDKINQDPAAAEIGELGLGTQDLPWSGRDIQDEKVLGTVHVATGRSDHLGGHITPDMFNHPENASHDDILFAPHKTPKIDVVEVRMHKDGATRAVIQHYRPTNYLKSVLD